MSTSSVRRLGLTTSEAARHLGGVVTAHMLSFTNRRHITVDKLEASRRELIASGGLRAGTNRHSVVLEVGPKTEL